MPSADLSGWFMRKVFLPFLKEVFPEIYRQPCLAPPGSETKIEYLRQRRQMGLPLWHPRDAEQTLRDVLLFAARGGGQVAIAAAVEVPPVNGQAHVEEVEKRHHENRYRSARELAERQSPEYKKKELQRRKSERQRRKSLGQIPSSEASLASR